MKNAHPLENDSAERAYFKALGSTNAVSAYRRLLEKLTGNLPPWAERKRGGRPRKQAAS